MGEHSEPLHCEPGGEDAQHEGRRAPKGAHRRPDPGYLFLDATFLDARWAREVENVSALVAYGIGLDGHRQLLAVTIGTEESEASWSDLLAQLNERGLSGVQLVYRRRAR